MWLCIDIQSHPFDLAVEEARVRQHAGDVGALVAFTGTVRAHDAQPPLVALHLEHYPEVTERDMARIAQQAAQRWPVQACRIVHRVGRLPAGAPIVLVLVACAHRRCAFDATQYIMDHLKTEAPFWKREEFADGSQHWVDARDSDAQASARWQQSADTV